MEESRLADLQRYFEEHPAQGVVAVHLFGSHAAGREQRESDVDLACSFSAIANLKASLFP